MHPTIDAALEALARVQHGAFSTEQAVERGATSSLINRRVTAGRWIRVAPRVYVLAGWPETFRQRAVVACLQAGPGAFASHGCAALLRRLDGVASAAVEITVPRRLRAIPARVKVHYSTDCLVYDSSMVDGIPTATVTRTILDMAAGAPVEVLERIFECGIRRKETSYIALQEMLERLARPGKPGVRRTREVLALVCRDGKRNGSELETRFYQGLRRARLPLPDRQRLVLRPDGTFAYSDYGYSWMPDVVYELLGYDFHSSRDSLDSDTRRNNDLNLTGKHVYEFTWSQVVREFSYVVRVVRATLRDARPEYRD